MPPSSLLDQAMLETYWWEAGSEIWYSAFACGAALHLSPTDDDPNPDLRPSSSSSLPPEQRTRQTQGRLAHAAFMAILDTVDPA